MYTPITVVIITLIGTERDEGNQIMIEIVWNLMLIINV